MGDALLRNGYQTNEEEPRLRSEREPGEKNEGWRDAIEFSKIEFSSSWRDIVSYVLFVCVGLSSWLLVNGIFLQLPIFFDALPEEYAISAYISIVIQCSNIVAVLYIAFDHIIYKIPAMAIIGGNIIFGIVTGLLCSFFWDRVIDIAQKPHSIALFFFAFASAVIGAVSVVSYYPFASLHRASLISGISTGMAMSAIVASIVSWIQNTGPDALFGVSAYMRILAFILSLSFISLLVLEWWKRKGYCAEDQVNEFQQLTEDSVNTSAETRKPRIAFSEVWREGRYAATIQLTICIMNYLILGILPYSVAGYGKDTAARLQLKLNVSGMIAGAIARYLSTFVRIYYIFWLSLIQFVLFVLLLLACIFGDSTPLPPNLTWILVLVNAVYWGLYGYTDTVAFLYGKKYFQKPYLIEHVARLVGAFNQLGAFIGASIAIVLVFTVLEDSVGSTSASL